jgi:hypothetical protein
VRPGRQRAAATPASASAAATPIATSKPRGGASLAAIRDLRYARYATEGAEIVTI